MSWNAWNKKEGTVAAPTVSSPSVARPEPEPALAVALSEDYLEVAQSLGMSSQAVLHNFLLREEIPIYNTERVEHYMASITEPDHEDWEANRRPGRIIWCWAPLRSKDQRDPEGKFTVNWDSNGHVAWHRCYQKPVPLFALKIAERISQRFPESVLLVADRIAIKAQPPGGDPFLGVMTSGGPRWTSPITVVAVWDEPGF